MNDKKYARRLAAVLCADVRGYTRLMAAAEEDVHRLTVARLDLFRTHIASFGGRIVNIAGDGVLADFPSVVSAVEFAVDIQRRLLAANSELPENRRVEFRVGINLGEVIVDGDHIFGDCVNVAERLQQISEANGICISQDVYHQVRNKLSYGYAPLGKQRLKNVSDPIDVFRIQFDTDITNCVYLATAGQDTGSLFENYHLYTSRTGTSTVNVQVFDEKNNPLDRPLFLAVVC